jgi:hypothetical protein
VHRSAAFFVDGAEQITVDSNFFDQVRVCLSVMYMFAALTIEEPVSPCVPYRMVEMP